MDNYNDPEVFLKGVAASLSEFAPAVIERVAGPTGLVLSCKFPPSIAEIHQACIAAKMAIVHEEKVNRMGWYWSDEENKWVFYGA